MAQEQLPGIPLCCAGTVTLLFAQTVPAWEDPWAAVSLFPESLQLTAASASQSQLGSLSLGSSKRSSSHKAVMFYLLNYRA